jgi:hypothetical protein
MNKPSEIAMSHDQIETLIEGQQQQQKSIDQLSVHIVRLTTIIAGNELDKQDRGMIGRLEKVEKNQESAKKYAWMILGAGAVVIFIIKYILH